MILEVSRFVSERWRAQWMYFQFQSTKEKKVNYCNEIERTNKEREHRRRTNWSYLVVKYCAFDDPCWVQCFVEEIENTDYCCCLGMICWLRRATPQPHIFLMTNMMLTKCIIYTFTWYNYSTKAQHNSSMCCLLSFVWNSRIVFQPHTLNVLYRVWLLYYNKRIIMLCWVLMASEINGAPETMIITAHGTWRKN